MAAVQDGTKRKYGEMMRRNETRARTESISITSNISTDKRYKFRGKTEGNKGLKGGRNSSLKFGTGTNSSDSESEIDSDDEDGEDDENSYELLKFSIKPICPQGTQRNKCKDIDRSLFDKNFSFNKGHKDVAYLLLTLMLLEMLRNSPGSATEKEVVFYAIDSRPEIHTFYSEIVTFLTPYIFDQRKQGQLAKGTSNHGSLSLRTLKQSISKKQQQYISELGLHQMLDHRKLVQGYAKRQGETKLQLKPDRNSKGADNTQTILFRKGSPLPQAFNMCKLVALSEKRIQAWATLIVKFANWINTEGMSTEHDSDKTQVEYIKEELAIKMKRLSQQATHLIKNTEADEAERNPRNSVTVADNNEMTLNGITYQSKYTKNNIHNVQRETVSMMRMAMDRIEKENEDNTGRSEEDIKADLEDCVKKLSTLCREIVLKEKISKLNCLSEEELPRYNVAFNEPKIMLKVHNVSGTINALEKMPTNDIYESQAFLGSLSNLWQSNRPSSTDSTSAAQIFREIDDLNSESDTYIANNDSQYSPTLSYPRKGSNLYTKDNREMDIEDYIPEKRPLMKFH